MQTPFAYNQMMKQGPKGYLCRSPPGPLSGVIKLGRAIARSILQPRLICGGVPSIYRWEVSKGEMPVFWFQRVVFLVSKGEIPVFWDEPSLTWLMNKPVTTHFSSFFCWIPSPSPGVGPQRRFQKPFLWNLVLKACVRMTQWEHHGPLGLEKTRLQL